MLERRSLLALGAGLAALGPVAGRAQVLIAPGGQAATRKVVDLMAGDQRFTRFVALLVRARLVEDLRGAGPFSVFAPLDSAFGGVAAGALQDRGGSGTANDQLSPDLVPLQAVGHYHVLPGRLLLPAEAVAAQDDQTLNTTPLRLASEGGGWTLSNPSPGPGPGFGSGGLNIQPPARIVEPGLAASNGVVHVIDGVLFP
jgi:uncharacterized surface protein with fasciclin (FAS1) repeats